MKGTVSDRDSLGAISPAALSAYARSEGWTKAEEYGEYSDIYVADNLPELVIPRTIRLGDYSEVVFRLIGIFAEMAGADELSLYRDLVTADRDVIRCRAAESEDGSIPLHAGVNLVEGARDLLLAAACSLKDPRRLYRAGANREASDFLQRVRLGQTEHGSFAVTLLTPVVSPPTQLQFDQDWGPDDDPLERRVTNRLAEALEATRSATEQTNSGASEAFAETVPAGVSANFCEALVQLIGPFQEMDVSVVWARTRPRLKHREVARFSQVDAPILGEAARSFRSREPRLDQQLVGFVQRLKRDQSEVDGTVTIRAPIEGKTESVTAVLGEGDYTLAVQANENRAAVIAEGDLERKGQRWHLRNPRIRQVIHNESDDSDV